jgi:hypothetical protein
MVGIGFLRGSVFAGCVAGQEARKIPRKSLLSGAAPDSVWRMKPPDWLWAFGQGAMWGGESRDRTPPGKTYLEKNSRGDFASEGLIF